MNRELLILALGLACAELHFIVFRRLWLNKLVYWQQVKTDMESRHEAEAEAWAALSASAFAVTQVALAADMFADALGGVSDAFMPEHAESRRQWRAYQGLKQRRDYSAWQGGSHMNAAEVEQAGVEWQRKGEGNG